MKSIPVDWIRNLQDKQEQEKFEELVRHNRALLTRLREIYDEKLAAIEILENSKDTYAEAGYPYWQAHVNGRRAALKELRKLLDFLDQ